MLNEVEQSLTRLEILRNNIIFESPILNFIIEIFLNEVHLNISKYFQFLLSIRLFIVLPDHIDRLFDSFFSEIFTSKAI